LRQHAGTISPLPYLQKYRLPHIFVTYTSSTNSKSPVANYATVVQINYLTFAFQLAIHQFKNEKKPMKKITFTLMVLCLTIFCHAQLSWLKMANYPGTGRFAPVSFSINGKGYMGLGIDQTNNNCPKDWYEYNPTTNTWTKKADFPGTGRFTATTFVIDGKGYMVCGSTTSGLLDHTYEYDPSSDTWTQKAYFPGGARQNAAGFSIGNKGYVGTGYSSGGSYSDFYEYNPATNQWSQKSDVPGPARNTGVGFSINDKGYIGLGNATNSISNFNDLYEYDTLANGWTKKADFPLYSVGASTCYSNTGSAYVFGGYYYQYSGISHNPLNTLFKYDQASNTWTLEGTFPGLPRGYAGGFSLSNDIYVAGGSPTNTPDGNIIGDVWKLSNGLTLMVHDPNGNVDFGLYPNPSNGVIFIEAGRNADAVRIYNSAGSTILNYDFNKASGSIDVSNLSAGLYFIEIVTTTGEVLDSKFSKF
jgi:N-acetylneuraminic acid mutarotase